MKTLVKALLMTAALAVPSGALAQAPSETPPSRPTDASPAKSDAPKKNKDAKKQTKPSKTSKKSKPSAKKARKAGKTAK